MIEMIHKLTGSKMFVSEEKLEEYKAAGHKVAAAPKETEKPKAKKTTKSKK